MTYAPEYYDEDGVADGPDVNIKAEAAKPQSTTVDGTTITERSIGDQIAADRHAAAKRQATGYAFGVGFRRINPGSAVRE